MGGVRRLERPAAALPAATDVRQPTNPRRTWRDKVRNAVDLTVAFVLLEDADAPASERPTTEHRSPHASVDVRHAHRKPLRPMPRPRRPGAVAQRPQVCTAPIGPPPSEAPKRRTRAV